MNKLLYLLLIAVCWSCSQDSETEKHQSKRDQVVDVRDKMKEFSTQDVLIGRISRTYLIDNYLIVTDYNSPDKLIHLFDKNTFEHLASSTYQGQGPDEITIIGHVGIDETNRRFFVSDHGKLKIFAYDLDSVLTTPEYQPSVKIDMKKKLWMLTGGAILGLLAALAGGLLSAKAGGSTMNDPLLSDGIWQPGK